MRAKQIQLLNLLTIGMMTLLGPCDETLPPYTVPEKVFAGAITATYSKTASIPEGGNLSVLFSFTNEYEETLQDTVDLHGTIQMVVAKAPTVKKTFFLDPGAIFGGSEYYNRQTRILTLDPGKSITFRAVWNFNLSDDSVEVRKTLFQFYQDPTCTSFCIASKEDIVLLGELFIVNDKAPVRASVVYPLCYSVGLACGAVITDQPCAQQPATNWPRCYPYTEN